MLIHDVSAYLMRFDAPTPSPPEVDLDVEALLASSVEGLIDAPLDAPSEQPFIPEEPAIDPQALREQLETEFAASLAAEREAHEANLRLAREQWVEQEAEAIGQRLTQALDFAIESLRDDVARVLSPFVSREIGETALDELITSVRRAIANESAPALSVCGPKDLVAKISLALGNDVALHVVEGDSVDVTVDLSPIRIETRLEEWMRLLSEEGNHDR
jgi:hypothetical protein